MQIKVQVNNVVVATEGSLRAAMSTAQTFNGFINTKVVLIYKGKEIPLPKKEA